MLPLLFLSLTSAPAYAGAVFGTANGPISLDLSGNWPRAYPDDTGGWVMFHAGGGDFKVSHAYSDLTTDRSRDKNLTGRNDLKDHDIRPCPDGTWLQASTADYTAEQAHDSAYSWRYDKDFNILANGIIAQGDLSGPSYVDMPVVCGNNFQGAAFPDAVTETQARFAKVERDAGVLEEYDLVGAPWATGSSMLEDRDGTLYVVGFSSVHDLSQIVIGHFDTNYNSLGTKFVTVGTDILTPYWAQTVIRVGDYYIVSHMMRDESLNWNQQDGDLYLTAFDIRWDVVDQIQLSDNTAPVGGMQPYVVSKGDGSLLAMYSKELHNYAFTIELQPGIEDGGDADTDADTDTDTDVDTSVPDTADSGEVTDSVPDSGVVREKTGCGCTSAPSSTGAAGLMLGLAALLMTRRK
jgi:MYXO-CTERM domain-containing protein